MVQPNEPAGAADDPLAALKVALTLLLPNQPATTLQTPTFEWTRSNQSDEQNIQFCLICALKDSELVKKLFILDLKATTAKMFKTCRTHIAIANNLNAMGLRLKLSMLSTNRANDHSLTYNNSNKKHQHPRNNMHVGIALSPMHLAEPPTLPRTPHADHVAELVTGTPDAKAPPVDRRIQTRSHPDRVPKVENKSRPTVLI